MANPQNNTIPFYNKGESYYQFTNFAKVPFNISEIPQNLNLSPHLVGDWKTSEHLFQAAKFTDQNIIEKIRNAPDTGLTSPGGVFWLANSKDGAYKDKIRIDWLSISVEVMRWVTKEKFTQNEWLKNDLLETGDAQLIEDSGSKDNFWGNGAKGNGINYPFNKNQGKNKLGIILMDLRTELKNSTSKHPLTPPQTPPTDNSSQQEQPKKSGNTSPEPNSEKPNKQNQKKNNKSDNSEGGDNPSPNSLPKPTTNPELQPNTSNLTALHDQAITTITTALNQEPKISESELLKPNWKELIQKATNEKEINNLQEEILEEIKQKRIAEEKNKELTDLLAEAQTKDTYEELESVIKKIRALNHLNFYQEKQTIIQELENKLAQLNPIKYKESVQKEIAEEFKNQGLTAVDLTEQLKKKLTNPTNEEREKIITYIKEKGAENELKKLLAIAQRAKSTKEKKDAKQQLIRFIKKQNRFSQQAYQNNIKEVESSLARLRDDETEMEQKPNNNGKNLLIIGGCLIAIALLLVAFIKVSKRKRLKRKK